MTKLNQPLMARAVEDDEQRLATTPGRAGLQIDEQRFKLASFNQQALLQIGIAFFFMIGKEKEREKKLNKPNSVLAWLSVPSHI